MKLAEVEIRQNGISLEIDKVQFALALKTYRLRQGLTQEALGQKWGCSRYTILRAESGRGLTWEQAYRIFAKLSNELEKENRTNSRQCDTQR